MADYNNSNTYKENGSDENIDVRVLEYQTNKITKNYDYIDELQMDIETNTRKLMLLAKETNTLNKLVYIFKYITIISITMLIFMICIFILNFNNIKDSATIAKEQANSFFKTLKSKRIKV